MDETLEAHEHAEEAAHGGRRHTALLIAILAAGLAFCEQGAHHADARMAESAVSAADIWAQYQAKSTRINETSGLAAITAVIPGIPPEQQAALQAKFAADLKRFESDPASGKTALAAHARTLEAERDAARHTLDIFDYAAAALQLGIVLTTASVITGARSLVWGGALLGLAGAALAIWALL